MGANVGIPSSEDLFLLHEGSLFHSYRILGAHVSKTKGQEGVRFAVWAPHAKQVYLLGDFNELAIRRAHRWRRFSTLRRMDDCSFQKHVKAIITSSKFIARQGRFC